MYPENTHNRPLRGELRCTDTIREIVSTFMWFFIYKRKMYQLKGIGA